MQITTVEPSSLIVGSHIRVGIRDASVDDADLDTAAGIGMTQGGSPAACCGRWTPCGSYSPSIVSSRPPTGRKALYGLASSGAHGPRGRQAPRATAGWSGSCSSATRVVSGRGLPPRYWWRGGTRQPCRWGTRTNAGGSRLLRLTPAPDRVVARSHARALPGWRYSTVTDLARLRGWSISQPRSIAQ